MLAVTILGNNSAIPAHGRHPTAQVVTVGNELILLDCGEGTQMQMSSYKIKRSKINVICISHLHGDHYFGLIGLLTSYGLLGRTQALALYAPAALQYIIQAQLNAADTVLPYTLNFAPIIQSGLIHTTTKYTITAFETEHRIACYGFVIKQITNPRKINKENCLLYDIPLAYYPQLQQGNNYTNKQGVVITNELLTTATAATKSYAYCADTRYSENILPAINNCNLIYHETTYLHCETEKANIRYHSTSIQAATIATLANCKALIIGHFSSNYSDLEPHLTEAKSTFENTQLAQEGATYIVQ